MQQATAPGSKHLTQCISPYYVFVVVVLPTSRSFIALRCLSRIFCIFIFFNFPYIFFACLLLSVVDAGMTVANAEHKQWRQMMTTMAVLMTTTIFIAFELCCSTKRAKPSHTHTLHVFHVKLWKDSKRQQKTTEALKMTLSTLKNLPSDWNENVG